MSQRTMGNAYLFILLYLSIFCNNVIGPILAILHVLADWIGFIWMVCQRDAVMSPSHIFFGYSQEILKGSRMWGVNYHLFIP